MSNDYKSSTPFRWGILGTGKMADKLARELSLHDGAVITAVASRSKSRSFAFAESHGIGSSFDSYEALIASADVDIVYDATTNDRHFENAMMCLHHGKPALVEKPICLCTPDLDELVEAHDAGRSFLMEAMWMRFFPTILKLKETLASIEPLISMEAVFGIHVPFDERHRIYAPKLGGGALFDLGVYPLNLAHLLFGLEAQDVKVDIEWAPTGVDETADITLVYDSGLTARLFCSASKHTPHRATFKGERGVVVIEDFFHPSRIDIEVRGGDRTSLSLSYPFMGYNFEIDEVHRAVAAGEKESPLMPLAWSRDVLSLIERITGSRAPS